MKLLPPQQLNDLKEADKVRDLIRTKEMADEATRTRKALANAEADFQATLAVQRYKWALEFEAQELEIKNLNKEVIDLEDRKARALIPIDIYKKQAEQLTELANVAMADAKTKSEENEGLSEHLQDKLDEVGQKLQDAKAWELRLNEREKGIVIQSQQVIDGNKDLNNKIAEFMAKIAKAEQDMNERKTALVLWDRSLVAKDEKLEAKAKQLEVLAIQLTDQRLTLERAMKRLDIPL